MQYVHLYIWATLMIVGAWTPLTFLVWMQFDHPEKIDSDLVSIFIIALLMAVMFTGLPLWMVSYRVQ